MKKLFLLLTFVSLFTACKDDDGPSGGKKENAPITVMGYFIANASGIEDDIFRNIAAMYDGLALMKKPATLLVYWDGSGDYGQWEDPVILRYTTDGKGNVNGQKQLPEDATANEVVDLAEVVKQYPSQLSVDKSVMTQVLKDMIAVSPTERVGLVAASHGSAWTNSIFMSRSFGQDGKGTDNTMLVSDMADAMKATGKKFDFLLFDACFMGTAEVCYDFRDVTDYQIVSVMEVPAYGFPYESSLDYLYEGTVDGYKKICQAYTDFYKQRYENGNQAWGTIALVDSKEMEGLADATRAEIVEHKDVLGNDFDESDIQEYGKQGGRGIAYDLGQLMAVLNNGTMPNAFADQLNKTVLYKSCLEIANPSSYKVDAANYCGLGVYIPIRYNDNWNDFFKTISWYTVAGWNEVTFSWDF
jgi:hypothetical protein